MDSSGSGQGKVAGYFEHNIVMDLHVPSNTEHLLTS
jgi:hypothetical protein